MIPNITFYPEILKYWTALQNWFTSSLDFTSICLLKKYTMDFKYFCNLNTKCNHYKRKDLSSLQTYSSILNYPQEFLKLTLKKPPQNLDVIHNAVTRKYLNQNWKLIYMTCGTNTLPVNIIYHSYCYLNISFFDNLVLVCAYKTLI